MLKAQVTDTIKLCPDLKRLPYYRLEKINDRDFKEVKEQFKRAYPLKQMRKLKRNTGILTIRFNINCYGKIGSFDLFSCDLKYNKNEMANELTGYLLQRLKDLDQWKPPVDETDGACNVHAFYSFRIVDGEIKEILPK